MEKRGVGRRTVYKEKEDRKLCFTSRLPGETQSRSQCAIYTGDTENENGDVCLGKWQSDPLKKMWRLHSALSKETKILYVTLI